LTQCGILVFSLALNESILRLFKSFSKFFKSDSNGSEELIFLVDSHNIASIKLIRGNDKKNPSKKYLIFDFLIFSFRNSYR